MLALPRTSTLSVAWTSVGPPAVATANYGNVTGRITAIAIDPADSSGNTVYVGTTGGGVWKSTNAAGPSSQVAFSPLTDTLPVYSANAGTGVLPSLSIGAVAIGNGVLLAGTGDPNDALDSYWGEGILRSADGGATWTLAQGSLDGITGNHSFFGLSVAGFAFSSLTPSLVVAAVSQAAEGDLVNAPDRTNSVMGLYYSSDAGSTWHMSTLVDGGQTVQAPQPAGGNNGGNAATAVVWNALRQQFIAAVRFHGYYSSSDGANWTRLPAQPGAGLTTASCPVNANTSGSKSCPIFRGALSVQPATSDTFALTVDGNNQDEGLFQDVCAAASGSCSNPAINFGTRLNSTPLESGNAQIPQGDYNLALSAAPSGSDTILYAGTIDLYRCSLGSGCSLRNTTNAENGCLNNAHVAPAQHAIATLGGASGPLVFTGNDGGLNRSTDGVSQTGGVCSASDATHFDNLNAAFGTSGSLAEVVSFAQDPSDPNALLAGLGALGSAGTGNPASPWMQLATGEGGFVAIDPVTPANWFLSNGAGISVALCDKGSACRMTDFASVIGAAQVNHDVAAIHAPFLLDPQLPTNLIVGTCRVWRGLASGSGWPGPNAISRPFGAPSANGCSSSFPVVRSLGAGGPLSNASAIENAGSSVLYAGLAGSLDGGQGLGGHLFVTSSANTADATSVWTDAANAPVTNDQGSGGVFNLGGFDVSSVVADAHDATGRTVYATIMGFAGNGVNAPHVYRSIDAGAHWTNISANLPNAPANDLLVDPNDANTVYVAMDTGVYVTSSVTTCSAANCWSIFGTALPNAPAVGLKASAALPTGDGRLGELRVATYGRGIWQIPLLHAVAPASASISSSPNPVNFATQQVGTMSGNVTVTVTNSGNADLHISSVVTAGDFFATDTCVGVAIAPSATCSVNVKFAPSATGQRSGSLTIYGDVSGGQVSETLTGTGSASAAIVLTPGVVSFPSTSVGATSAAINITIANTGGTTSHLQSVNLSGDFRIAANTCGSSLASQTSCTVGILFAPTLAGLRTGTLTVSDDAGVQVANLSGTAFIPATDALSPLQLSFAVQALGSIGATQQVTLTNAGDVALTLISSKILNGDFTVSNGCGNSLNGHSSCALLVGFSPRSIGVQTGLLQFADQFRSQTVALTGTGIAPAGVSLSPMNGLIWGGVGVGITSPAETVTLTNNGGLPLQLSSITATGDFALVAGANTCGSSVAPSATCTVAVTFLPTATGKRSGAFTIRDDATNPVLTIALSGMGVDFALQQDGPNSITIGSGSSASYALLLDSPSGVSGNATLTCAGVPAHAFCAIDPVVVPLGGGKVLITVTVATGVTAAAAALPHVPATILPLAWAALVLPLGWAVRRSRRLPLHLCGLAVGLFFLAGCGAGRSVPGTGTSAPTSAVTPSGTYALNIAASSAGLVRAVSLTIVVK